MLQYSPTSLVAVVSTHTKRQSIKLVGLIVRTGGILTQCSLPFALSSHCCWILHYYCQLGMTTGGPNDLNNRLAEL